jgi:hypothetical protein
MISEIVAWPSLLDAGFGEQPGSEHDVITNPVPGRPPDYPHDERAAIGHEIRDPGYQDRTSSAARRSAL